MKRSKCARIGIWIMQRAEATSTRDCPRAHHDDDYVPFDHQALRRPPPAITTMTMSLQYWLRAMDVSCAMMTNEFPNDLGSG
jgi:hypothetical protein